jgi:flotillin
MDNPNLLPAILVVLVLLIFAFLLLSVLGSAYRKVGPNKALVVYGMGTGERGRVVTSGGTFVFPMFQHADELSLELRSFDVAPKQALYTVQGVPVRVEAVTQLQVRNDVENILTHAQQTASKPSEEIDGIIKLVMEGHLRGIVGQLKVEDLVTNAEMVSERMRELAAADMANMGLEIVSFTIREVQDETRYIENMGRPAWLTKQNDTDIAGAMLQRELKIRRAEAQREADEQAAQQDMERVAVVTESEARQYKSRLELQLKQVDYDNQLQKRRAEIALIPDIETAIQERRLAEERTRTQEALMRAKEMELQVLRIAAAKTEAQHVQIMADADRQREIIEADGRAAARRKVAEADAEAIRLKGMAEAEVIRAQGKAEADAMQVRATAYREYGEAAMLDRLIEHLPEIVKGFAEPLTKVDKITIISAGGADGANLGASRLTGDVVNMAAQAQSIIQALTGHDLRELMGRIPGLGAPVVEGSKVNGNGHTAAPGTSRDGAAPLDAADGEPHPPGEPPDAPPLGPASGPQGPDVPPTAPGR